ncbi:MAG: tetratricopeptide repeat protein [Gemmatimonadaceae bacterium]
MFLSRLTSPISRRPLDEPISAPDPEQLPLGMFEGEPLLPFDGAGAAAADEVAVAPMREPPVCGEWSYDDSELERAAGRRADGVTTPTKATPVPPLRATAEPRRAPARPAPRDPSVGTVVRPRPEAPAPPRALRPTIEALRLAFEQTPGDTQRALAFAAALERSGDSGAALAALDAAAAAGADDFAISCARASVYGTQLRYDDAAKMIRRAAKLRPDDAEVLLQTGMLACRRGRWRDAIEPLQRGVALAPENAMAHYFVGEALNHADRLVEALAAYERASELDPEHWRALKGVGIVLDRLGRSPEAAIFYRRARDAQRP